MKVRKLLLVLLLIVISCFCLCACDEGFSNTHSDSLPMSLEAYLGDRFGFVEYIASNTAIVFDRNTRVEYICYENNNKFTITALLDSDGTPLLYKGN